MILYSYKLSYDKDGSYFVDEHIDREPFKAIKLSNDTLLHDINSKEYYSLSPAKDKVRELIISHYNEEITKLCRKIDLYREIVSDLKKE